jgi:hypothetical protein
LVPRFSTFKGRAEIVPPLTTWLGGLVAWRLGGLTSTWVTRDAGKGCEIFRMSIRPHPSPQRFPLPATSRLDYATEYKNKQTSYSGRNTASSLTSCPTSAELPRLQRDAFVCAERRVLHNAPRQDHRSEGGIMPKPVLCTVAGN